MATTPEYGWELPDVGLDANTWGDILNDTSFPAVEQTVKGVKTTADGALQRNDDTNNRNKMQVRLEVKQPTSTDGIRLIRSDGDADTDKWDLVINAATDTMRLYKGLDGFVDPADAMVASFKRANLETTPGYPGSDNRVLIRQTADSRYLRKDADQTMSGQLTVDLNDTVVTTGGTKGFVVNRSGAGIAKFLVNSSGYPRIDNDNSGASATAIFYPPAFDPTALAAQSVITKEFGDALYVSNDAYFETAWGTLNCTVANGAENVRRGNNLDTTAGTGTRKLATGRYQVVFETPSPGTHYAITFGFKPPSGDSLDGRYFVYVDNGTKATTGFIIETRDFNGTLTDLQDVYFDVRF